MFLVFMDNQFIVQFRVIYNLKEFYTRVVKQFSEHLLELSVIMI